MKMSNNPREYQTLNCPFEMMHSLIFSVKSNYINVTIFKVWRMISTYSSSWIFCPNLLSIKRFLWSL